MKTDVEQEVERDEEKPQLWEDVIGRRSFLRGLGTIGIAAPLVGTAALLDPERAFGATGALPPLWIGGFGRFVMSAFSSPAFTAPCSWTALGLVTLFTLEPEIVAWADAIAMVRDGRIHDAKSMLGLLICDRLRTERPLP